MKKSIGRNAFKIVNTLLLVLFCVICLLPFWHLLMASLSTPEELGPHNGCGFLLLPLSDEGFVDLDGYKNLFQLSPFWPAIANSLFYIAAGGVLTVIFSYCGAYCIKRNGIWSKPFTLMLVIASVFSAGIVPAYVVHKAIGLYNNRWALIMIGLLNIFYIVYILSVMERLPGELEDAAELDGAGAFMVLFKIIFPLTKFAAAAVFLICAVARWNDWVMPLIYSTHYSGNWHIWPLQLLVYEYSTYFGFDPGCYFGTPSHGRASHMLWSISVISALLPLGVIYPLVSRALKKSVTIGAIKG